jgi:hypothetical protein
MRVFFFRTAPFITMHTIPQIDPGELPNNMTREQALKLGLLPAVTADGTDDFFSDTGTPVKDFNRASKEVAKLLSEV